MEDENARARLPQKFVWKNLKAFTPPFSDQFETLQLCFWNRQELEFVDNLSLYTKRRKIVSTIKLTEKFLYLLLVVDLPKSMRIDNSCLEEISFISINLP